MVHVYVAVEQDDEGYPPVEAEELDATKVGPTRYRIDGVPVFVRGLARGDIVLVEDGPDDQLWVTEVAESSGSWTVRVLPWDRDALEAVAREFEGLGCHGVVSSYGLVALDVPATVEVKALMAALEAGRAQKRWDFEIGVDPIGS